MEPIEPDDVSTTSVYAYAGELIVELTARDADADLVVFSYEFDRSPPGSGVTPRGDVEERYVAIVASALESEGYEWIDGE